MPRAKIYPRFNGRLELHREKTLSKLNVDKVTEFYLITVDEILTSFLDTCIQWWWIETGFTLKIEEDVEDPIALIWTVEDTRNASMVYHWLKPKAIKYEGRIVKKINYLIKEGICGNVT